MKKLRSLLRNLKRDEEGVTAIEFAFLFPLFLAVFLGLVTFGIIFVLQQAMTLAAEEGARAAIAVNSASFDTPDEYEGEIRTRAEQIAANFLAWLPGGLKDFVDVNVGFDNATGLNGTVIVTITYPYGSNPIIPVFPLPLVGEILVPETLTAQAQVQLSSASP
jgi:Flp pilus assembly protein TadG